MLSLRSILCDQFSTTAGKISVISYYTPLSPLASPAFVAPAARSHSLLTIALALAPGARAGSSRCRPCGDALPFPSFLLPRGGSNGRVLSEGPNACDKIQQVPVSPLCLPPARAFPSFGFPHPCHLLFRFVFISRSSGVDRNDEVEVVAAKRRARLLFI